MDFDVLLTECAPNNKPSRYLRQAHYMGGVKLLLLYVVIHVCDLDVISIAE